MPSGYTGEDIRAGISMADDVVHGAQQDLRSLARDVRWKGLIGSDRDEFLAGMSEDEFATLQEIAQAMGPKGMNKLESVLQEAVGLKGKE